MAREIRISPDGNAVAIRSDQDAEGNSAWGVMHALHGGAWAPASSVEGWTVITTDG